jgi:hypothetical protein
MLGLILIGMNTKSRNRFVAAFSASLCTPAWASVVYSQPTTNNDSNVGLGWYSSTEPRPTRNFKHADNFMLDHDQSIGSVRWWGSTEGISHTDLSNFDSFTIEFYTNRTVPSGNIRPRDLIATTSLNINEVNTLATGRTTPSGALEYMHEATLADLITIEAGETYWIAISARSINPASDTWQWQDSDDFDTRSSSFDYGQNRWIVLQDTDSAFELIAVPAPASSMLFIALSGLIAQRRRKQER